MFLCFPCRMQNLTGILGIFGAFLPTPDEVMRVFNQGLGASFPKNQCLTMGSFDGLHLGHQQILKELLRLGQAHQLPATVLTFDTHPRHFLRQNVPLIHTKEEKIQQLRAWGIDHLVTIPFDASVADLSPRAFIEEVLQPYFSPKIVVIGQDHRFGKDRAGDRHLLAEYAEKGHYALHCVADTLSGAQKISSSLIRSYILKGQIAQANQALGYIYPYTGVVVTGNKKGRSIGFPTANLHCPEPFKLLPANGVYAVKVHIEGFERSYTGMANIGYRPTINISLAPVFEVHILDFDAWIYGKKVTVALHDFLREERKFADVSALVAQLNRDKAAVRAYFSDLKNT